MQKTAAATSRTPQQMNVESISVSKKRMVVREAAARALTTSDCPRRKLPPAGEKPEMERTS